MERSLLGHPLRVHRLLASLDFYNAEARAWSIADAIWWAKEYNLDGYRLDAIKHVPLSWLTDLRQALNEEFTDPAGGRFYLVGETFDYGNRDLLKSFVDPDTMLDGQFDFPFKAQACSCALQQGADDVAVCKLDGRERWLLRTRRSDEHVDRQP